LARSEQARAQAEAEDKAALEQALAATSEQREKDRVEFARSAIGLPSLPKVRAAKCAARSCAPA